MEAIACTSIITSLFFCGIPFLSCYFFICLFFLGFFLLARLFFFSRFVICV